MIALPKSGNIRSLMAEWLRRRRLKDMKSTVHNLKAMGSKPGRVEFGVRSTSV